jgi:cystathionine beta-synthase
VKCNSILDAVGGTPLVRLNRVTKDLPAEVYVKADYLNPGGSLKDRIALLMIDEAERKGQLRAGGTIVEATTGNTGVGLALIAAVRGYKTVFTVPDKQSREKIDMLKAFGAEVIVCPTAVEPEDPRSYYSVAKKLAREIPNAYYANQYENASNPEAHYRTSGPEIWNDTEGKITHFVCGLGTGGTASGAGKYLKEQNPKLKVIGVDPHGSLFYEYWKTGNIGKARTYVVEGIGEDIIPSTLDF